MSLHSDLQRYLNAGPCDEKRRQENLALAMHRHILKCIARFGLRDPEDTAGQCMLNLWPQVDAMKRAGRCTVGNFDAYVARTARNRVIDGFRQKSPVYRNLGNEIKALLGGKLNTSGLAVWDDPESGEDIVGFDIWKGCAARMPRETFDDSRSRDAFAARWLGEHDLRKCTPDIVVEAVLSWNGAPMPVSQLVDTVYRLRGVEREFEVSSDNLIGDDGTRFIDLLPAPGTSVDETVIQQIATEEKMNRLWAIMSGLAVRQILALCLNLHQDEFMVLAVIAGSKVLTRILGSGAGTAELADLIARLPLPDREIAEILGESEQTVRNIRSAARKTIARRYQKEFPDEA